MKTPRKRGPGRPRKSPPSESGRALVRAPAPLPVSLDRLAAIPEERVWLESQQSIQTRRAYRRDVAHFMATLGITSKADFRKVDRMAVIAWKRAMENEGAKPRTIRRRLSALPSLFFHMVDRRVADFNPVREIRRPKTNRRQGTTASFLRPILL